MSNVILGCNALIVLRSSVQLYTILKRHNSKQLTSEYQGFYLLTAQIRPGDDYPGHGPRAST